jgi:uncharacterized Zn-binding protein involved in type VI secretion
MPSVARIGDSNSGHDLFPPTSLIEGSDNVLTNGIPTARIGDSFIVHCAPMEGCHSDVVTSGSGTVLVNGKPIARVGDSAMLATIIQGSDNVIAGG